LANHKSAKKRARQTIKKNLRNRVVKTKMKNVIKAVKQAEDKSPEEMTAILDQAKSVIDKAAKKGVIHKNNASRKISRLTKLVAKMSA